MKRLLLLLALVVPAAACASAQAKQPVESPSLEVPPAPPRVFEPLPRVAPPPPEPVPELPAPPAANTRPRPAPQSRETAKPDPKPEPPPVEPAPPVTAPPPAVPPLRTPNTPEGAEASRLIRDLLDRASKTLATVDYRVLPAGRRKEYDDAKQSILLAEDKLKSGDLDLAKNLAEKADKIAAQLQGR
jgi:hypothetical protein